MTDPKTDREVIAEARTVSTSSALAVASLIPEGEFQRGCVINSGEKVGRDVAQAFRSARTLADRLEALTARLERVKEMATWLEGSRDVRDRTAGKWLMDALTEKEA